MHSLPEDVGLRLSRAFPRSEVYTYDDEDSYAQFHLDDSGTVLVIAHNGPEVPWETLLWISRQAHRLSRGRGGINA